MARITYSARIMARPFVISTPLALLVQKENIQGASALRWIADASSQAGARGFAEGQPDGTHFADPVLNTATFFIRLEDKQGFRPILEDVQRSLGSQPGGVTISVRPDSKRHAKIRQMPTQDLAVPRIFVISDDAESAMDAIVAALPDHTAGGPNTSGAGTRSISTVEIGTDAALAVVDTAVSHSSAVTARWLVGREMRTLYPDSLALLDPEDMHADKLDAMVDRTSSAAGQFRQAGRELVEAYLAGSRLHVESSNLYKIGPLETDHAKATSFINAAHAAYELNNLELPVARVLDSLGFPWCRNPQGVGYRIPMLD